MTGPELRRWRRCSGLTQRELAYRVGYQPPNVTAMETGARPVMPAVEAYVRAHPAPEHTGDYTLDPAGLERALRTFGSYAVFARWWGVAELTLRRWRFGEQSLPMPLRAWLRAGAPHRWDGCTHWHRRRRDHW
jgi:transcriptional regulator with XRE-family HTH domain